MKEISTVDIIYKKKKQKTIITVIAFILATVLIVISISHSNVLGSLRQAFPSRKIEGPIYEVTVDDKNGNVNILSMWYGEELIIEIPADAKCVTYKGEKISPEDIVAAEGNWIEFKHKLRQKPEYDDDGKRHVEVGPKVIVGQNGKVLYNESNPHPFANSKNPFEAPTN